MTQCAKCRIEVYMPFVCNYCGELFCSDHRLPENHNCKKVGDARRPTARATQASSVEYRPLEEDWQPTSGAQVETYYEPDGTQVIIERVPVYAIERPQNPIWYFSALELKHLAIGLLLMFGVGVSMFFSLSLLPGGPVYEWWEYLTLAGFATLAFILHEFGHKFTGIRLGNWSEFRLIKPFAILTAISVIPIPFFKIVCPGAVQVTGDTNTTNMGKIALAGPIMNLIQAGIFVALANTIFISNWIFFDIMIISAYLNAFLGIFNLIPIGPLDGRKVIHWNKFYYIGTVILLIAFLIYIFPQI
ncbi:MAG TPA: AN1-type zinc finger domain-containing protein [Candidatus Deferrimicrobium sp.]|nr:AN1-type zinc finger domain-containing protein [Candidatus Deferrimicrobium sp.]